MIGDKKILSLVAVQGTERTWVPSSDKAGVLTENGEFDLAQVEVGYDNEGDVVEIRPAENGPEEQITTLSLY